MRATVRAPPHARSRPLSSCTPPNRKCLARATPAARVQCTPPARRRYAGARHAPITTRSHHGRRPRRPASQGPASSARDPRFDRVASPPLTRPPRRLWMGVTRCRRGRSDVAFLARSLRTPPLPWIVPDLLASACPRRVPALAGLQFQRTRMRGAGSTTPWPHSRQAALPHLRAKGLQLGDRRVERQAAAACHEAVD
jgi:hypothetical protein